MWAPTLMVSPSNGCYRVASALMIQQISHELLVRTITRDGAPYLDYPSCTFRTQPPSDRFPPDRRLVSISLRVFGRWLPRNGVQWEAVFHGSTSPHVAFPTKSLAHRKYRLLIQKRCDMGNPAFKSTRGFGTMLDHGCKSSLRYSFIHSIL